MGLMCSSFVSISSGTHRRAPFDPLGRSEIPMVALGNGLASRSLVSYNLLENVGKQIDKHCFALCKAYMGTFNQTLCIGHQHKLDLFQHGAPPQQKPWTGQSVSQTLILGLNGYTQPPGLCKGDKVVAMPCDIWWISPQNYCNNLHPEMPWDLKCAMLLGRIRYHIAMDLNGRIALHCSWFISFMVKAGPLKLTRHMYQS